MKKVMFFNRTFFAGGVEKALLDIVKNIDTDRYDITIFVRRFEGDLMPQYFALESERIHIRKCFDYIKPGRTILKKMLNVILIWIAEKCICKFPKIYYRIAIRDKFDVEVAYMHNEATAIVASSTNRKSKKIAWVHTDLRQIKTWKEYFGSRRRQKEFYRKFDKIICVSKLVKNCFEELLGKYPNIEVIFNPINVEYLKRRAEEELDFDAKSKIICAVGRLSWEKNFDMLIRSYSKLLQLGIDSTLWIVGEGPERKHLEDLTRKLEVENSIIFWGFQENPYKFIKASEFTVLCSKYEGFGIVCAESLILGKPVVSCCKSVEEIFDCYKCGIIIEENEQSLVMAMKQMLTDVNLYDRCVDETKRRSKEVTLEAVIEQIDKVLSE